jgi:hypothetical protein
MDRPFRANGPPFARVNRSLALAASQLPLVRPQAVDHDAVCRTGLVKGKPGRPRRAASVDELILRLLKSQITIERGSTKARCILKNHRRRARVMQAH